MTSPNNSLSHAKKKSYTPITRAQVRVLDEGYVSGYWCRVVGTAGDFLMIEERDGTRIDGFFRHVPKWRRLAGSEV